MEWWKRAVIYQVYPRSFQDSNGDGVGDLRGVFARLDYLQWLGVDTLWLSPIYPSPMVDFGYDVSDHCDVHRDFGAMSDFDALLAEVKRRGMRLILDLVPNHTSDRHPWFQASRTSLKDPNRDWYIWHDPGPDGGPPNNWQSVFGGSAWELDPATGQYYYHAYLKEQPDLNWVNPAVREGIKDTMRFWLERGVDGFRVDVIGHLSKDPFYRDNPADPAAGEGTSGYSKLLPIHTFDRNDVKDSVAFLRGVLDDYKDRVMIGEVYVPIPRLVRYYGFGCHLPFNFRLIELPWDATTIRSEIAAYEAALPPGAWPNWVLGNHDVKRIASRVGPAQTPVAAVLLLTLRGTPTLYQGDEIGTEQVLIPPGRVRDPVERTRPGRGRDGCRTPMQWNAEPNAGFSTGDPWLPLADGWETRNVEGQKASQDSLLALYRRMLALRRAEPALARGSISMLPSQNSVIAFIREHEGRRIACVLVLDSRPAEVLLPLSGRVLLATDRAREGEATPARVRLAGNDALVIALD